VHTVHVNIHFPFKLWAKVGLLIIHMRIILEILWYLV